VSQTSNPPQDSRSQLLLARNSPAGASPAAPAARTSPRNLLADEFPDETLPPRPDPVSQAIDFSSPLSSPPFAPLPDPTPANSFSSLTNGVPTAGEDDEARLRRRTADMELIQFAAQFRSLVHQMQQDVAAGALSADDSTPGSDLDGTPLTEGEEDYGFPVAALTAQAAFEAHLARTAPPEDRERMRVMLGRLVRRMPTIESLGSREATSVHRMPLSVATSRPATRLTMRSDSATLSSATPSRSNSLTLGRVVQGSTHAHPLPTPPTPVSPEGSYFSPVSGRASPSPLSGLSLRGGGSCPSRPPSPSSPYMTPATELADPLASAPSRVPSPRPS
jgi:hypothetical protein